MSLSFTKYLVPPGDHRWLVGRGVLVNPEPTPECPEPVRAADDSDASWLTADGKAADAPDDIATDIRGLPPARARLAQFVAWRGQVAERLANLQSGIDRLAADVARVTEAKDRLRLLRAADTSSILDNLRQGTEVALSAISGRQAQDLSAQLAASEHAAEVAAAAIETATPERDHFRAVLAVLDESLPGVVTDALAEHAELTLRAEYNAAESAFRDAAARLRSTGRFGPGSIEITIGYADLARHRPAWKRLEEAWLRDPRAAPAKHLRFKGK
jgi:hypothetical protein